MNVSALSLGNKFLAVSDSAGLAEVISLFGKTSAAHLPVTDSSGKVIGILSERDIRLASPEACARDLVSASASAVDEGASLSKVAEELLATNSSALLVTRNGRQVVGIVSAEDLLRYLVTAGAGVQSGTLSSLPFSPLFTEALRELNAVGL